MSKGFILRLFEVTIVLGTVVCVVTFIFVATAAAAVTIVVAAVVVVVDSSGICTQGLVSIGRRCFPSTVLRILLSVG